jgi:hypothetical protein
MKERIMSEDISFFFGAGASAAFGIPTMTQMSKNFKNELKKHGSSNAQQLYNDIYSVLKEEFKDIEGDMGAVDIERIFTIINGLQEYKSENIGELALYASKKISGKSLLDKEMISSDFKSLYQTIDELRDRFQKFIRSSCKIQNAELINSVYKHFFNTITAKLDRSSETPVSKVKFHPGWTLFTTNYDRCLEFFWGKDGEQITLDTGFDQNGQTGDLFLQAAGKLRIVKLHGSIYWLKNKKTGQVFEKDYDINQAEGIGTSSVYNAYLSDS